MAALTIAREDPRRADVARLVAELDAYMGALYPAESNHLLDLERLAGEDVVFLVARVEGEAAGCGALLVHGHDYGEVKRVWVHPDRRGSGLARRILARLEEEALRFGLGLLRLETGTRQPEALGLFKAQGFRPRGPFGAYPADDPLSVFMEKFLGEGVGPTV